MFLWLSIYTSDIFPLFLPPSLTFYHVINRFILQALPALLFGACGRDCNSQFNLNHLFNDAHLHPISLITCGTKDLAHQPFMPLLFQHDWSSVYAHLFTSSSLSTTATHLTHFPWISFFQVSQQFMCNCVHKHADATSPQVLLVVANRPVMYAILPFYLFC